MKYIRVLLLLLTPPALAEENKDFGDLLNEIAPEPGERQRSLAGFTCRAQREIQPCSLRTLRFIENPEV